MFRMSTTTGDARLDRLVSAAKDLGADEAKIIDAKEIVVDKRVRLKCTVPVCASHGRNLMCPPNLMSVEEFSEILDLYGTALILQVEAEHDSTDKSEGCLSKRTCDELEESTNTLEWQIKLHRLVNQLETAAFKEGFYLAAGLTGGDCRLCPECVTPQSGEPCRRPFEARPSMEAMGIDVLKTCDNVGLPLSLSSGDKVRWTGLVLLH
jgi:predicted metal-binding protein